MAPLGFDIGFLFKIDQDCSQITKALIFAKSSSGLSAAGDKAAWRFVEYVTANIRNRNTREAYGRTVTAFCAWCDERGQDFLALTPVVIVGYVERLLAGGIARPTVKQRLAAIRMVRDYMDTGRVLPFNPVASVRGPKHVVKRGNAPVFRADVARALLDSIDNSAAAGLRDRALIGVMVFSFAHVSAVVGMYAGDYFQPLTALGNPARCPLSAP